MVKSICSEDYCPKDRVCISTPTFRPLCIQPGGTTNKDSLTTGKENLFFLTWIELKLCGSSCHSRGICSSGHCICSNRTYIGDDCEMCRLNDKVTAGCLHIGHDSSSSPCMCYLTQSYQQKTPYLCTTMRYDRGEIGSSEYLFWFLFELNLGFLEVPCDRFVSSIKRSQCLRNLFSQPDCTEDKYTLIYDLHNEICICREREQMNFFCFNNGLLIIDEKVNSTICS